MQPVTDERISPLNGEIAGATAETAAAAKPRLRGWLHTAMAPVVLAAGIVLVAHATTTTARLTSVVYTACGLILFTTSATFHRGHWSTTATSRLRRADHGNIYLLIAGTYTPIVALGLVGFARSALLWEIWIAGSLGVAGQWLWSGAPRALYTILYVVIGWSLAPAFGELIHHAGVTVFTLLLSGGVIYTAGAVIYGLKRPNPAPGWFGFHELFHSCTIAAWTCQYLAISILSYR
jgi:hemolysin III